VLEPDSKWCVQAGSISSMYLQSMDGRVELRATFVFALAESEGIVPPRMSDLKHGAVISINGKQWRVKNG
jgi:hypothetical protein